jgi:hypothetical protein
MSANPAPNLEAFRSFLRGRVSQKTPVTGVTRVTDAESSTCELHGFVTRVTEIVGGFPASSDLDERQAIAEVEGGIPPLYSAGFAGLQLTPPPGLSVPQWLQAVDDAGRFLDAFGQQAQAMGWRADDLFRPDGLVRMLQGSHVSKLTSTAAALSDGRIFKRIV